MDIGGLLTAVQTLNGDDAFRPRLNHEQWRVLSQYLSRHEMRAGELLIRQGDSDRAMYLLEQGSLQVYATGAPPGTRIAILRPGAVVGELSLFVDGTRGANVETMTPCIVWVLRGPRIEELAQRVPALALEVLRAAGAVIAVRMRATMTRQMPMA